MTDFTFVLSDSESPICEYSLGGMIDQLDIPCKFILNDFPSLGLLFVSKHD